MFSFLGFKFGSIFFVMIEKLCRGYFAFVEHDWLNWSKDNMTHKESTG